MALKITDKAGAPDHFSWADCIVSIDDPGSDIRVVGPKHGVFILNEWASKPHSLNVCRAILEHAKHCGLTPESKLLVHCVLGVSRSTAVALGLEASLGLDPMAAWQRVYQARPVAWPSIALVGCFDDLLGLKGGLTEVALQVDQRRRGVDRVVC